MAKSKKSKPQPAPLCQRREPNDKTLLERIFFCWRLAKLVRERLNQPMPGQWQVDEQFTYDEKSEVWPAGVDDTFRLWLPFVLFHLEQDAPIVKELKLKLPKPKHQYDTPRCELLLEFGPADIRVRVKGEKIAEVGRIPYREEGVIAKLQGWGLKAEPRDSNEYQPGEPIEIEPRQQLCYELWQKLLRYNGHLLNSVQLVRIDGMPWSGDEIDRYGGMELALVDESHPLQTIAIMFRTDRIIVWGCTRYGGVTDANKVQITAFEYGDPNHSVEDWLEEWVGLNMSEPIGLPPGYSGLKLKD